MPAFSVRVILYLLLLSTVVFLRDSARWARCCINTSVVCFSTFRVLPTIPHFTTDRPQCRLARGLGWAHVTMYLMGVVIPMRWGTSAPLPPDICFPPDIYPQSTYRTFASSRTCVPPPYMGLLPSGCLPPRHLTWCLGQIVSDDWGISAEALRDVVVLLEKDRATRCCYCRGVARHRGCREVARRRASSDTARQLKEDQQSLKWVWLRSRDVSKMVQDRDI